MTEHESMTAEARRAAIREALLEHTGSIYEIEFGRGPNARTARDVSVEGWHRVLGALGLAVLETAPPVWMDGNRVLCAVRVPTPTGGSVWGYAPGVITPDQANQHVELARITSFAFRAAMVAGWRGAALAAGVDVNAPDDGDAEDARPVSARSAPQPPRTRLYGDELAAAARSYTERARAAQGEREQMVRVHEQAVAVGLRWDKDGERYVEAE